MGAGRAAKSSPLQFSKKRRIVDQKRAEAELDRASIDLALARHLQNVEDQRTATLQKLRAEQEKKDEEIASQIAITNTVRSRKQAKQFVPSNSPYRRPKHEDPLTEPREPSPMLSNFTALKPRATRIYKKRVRSLDALNAQEVSTSDALLSNHLIGSRPDTTAAGLAPAVSSSRVREVFVRDGSAVSLPPCSTTSNPPPPKYFSAQGNSLPAVKIEEAVRLDNVKMSRGEHTTDLTTSPQDGATGPVSERLGRVNQAVSAVPQAGTADGTIHKGPPMSTGGNMTDLWAGNVGNVLGSLGPSLGPLVIQKLKLAPLFERINKAMVLGVLASLYLVLGDDGAVKRMKDAELRTPNGTNCP